MQPVSAPWAALPQLDTHDPEAVGAYVRRIFEQLFPGSDSSFITRRFRNLAEMFAGYYVGFQAMDTLYHDLEHTLQATVCMVDLMRGREDHGEAPPLTADDFNIGLLAIMLHDLGYLKREGDTEGTGAKYTHIHEIRSCEHARAYLHRRDWPESAIVAVENLIRCTGPRSSIAAIPFQNATEKRLGQMVCTADFIGQMSDPRYVEKLPVLYREFVESYDFQGLGMNERPFANYEDLLAKTPGFYDNFVIPRMEKDCGGVWHFLDDPATGRNPYREAVEANIAQVRELVA
ncbi:MAG: hypothetical protein ACFB21_05605 [Opitutales bacterium]